MKKVASKDNKTLNITKGKEYEVWTFMEVKGLVLVENNVGDNVIMSKYDFEDKKEDYYGND
ncbi:hypothetical protein P59_208 [Bacillus phage P59]|nr:hypothetical protein P59_208 [Bacillus phage P59]